MKKKTTDSLKIDELLTRGVSNIVDKNSLRQKLQSGEQLRIKLGIDPTGPKMHLGRSIPLLKLRDFQELGHQVVLIIGSFTGQIGDTSDKDAERPMLSEEQVRTNMAEYVEQISSILDVSAVEVRYNDEWLSKLTLSDVIRLADGFGLHEFTSRELIKKRMEAGKRVNLRELLYPLMQGYDSVAVKADVEIGGSDQWFNLLTGRTVQPLYGQVPQDIMVLQLIDGTDGQKMSTSKGNTCFLSASAEEIFGTIMSIRDELIIPYFNLLTRVPMAEVAEFEKQLKAGENPRDIKEKLAIAVTSIYHGVGDAKDAAANFVSVFANNERPTELPKVQLTAGERLLADVLVDADLASSKSEARRLISQGGVKVDDAVISEPGAQIAVRSGIVLQIGKRRWAEVEVDG